MKSKKVLAILLSVAIMLTFMPVMAFAAEGDTPAGDSSAAVLKGAYVTTDDTTEPIQYDTFAEAYAKTNDADNVGKHATITLCEDAAMPDIDATDPLKAVNTQLTIVLNGKKLTGVPADGTIVGSIFDGVAQYFLCIHTTDESVIVDIHHGNEFYSWAEDTNVKNPPADMRWYVEYVTTACETCNTLDKQKVSYEPRTTDPTGWQTTSGGGTYSTSRTQSRTRTSIQYYCSYDATNDEYVFALETTTETQTHQQTKNNWWDQNWTTTSTSDWIPDTPVRDVKDRRPANTPDPESTYSVTGLKIVEVNGVNQHENGKPVVTATMTDANGNTVTPSFVVTAQTKAELDKWNEDHGTTYANEDPTCAKMGIACYKVEVVDPNGKVAYTDIVEDKQASDKVAHKAGLLVGYRQLVRDNDSTEYTTEAQARKAGKAAGKTVVKVTAHVLNEGEATEKTVYHYWSYKDTVDEITGTDTGASASVAITIDALAYEDNGSFTFKPVFICDYETGFNPTKVDGEPITINPFADATTKAEKDKTPVQFSDCVTWKYPAKEVAYTFTKVAQTASYTRTLTFANKDKTSKYYSHVSDGVHVDPQEAATCLKKGTANATCAICEQPSVTVYVDKLDHKYGLYNAGTYTGKTIENIEPKFVVNGTTLTSTEHTVTLSTVDNVTVAKVEPTCEQPGGTFKYCTGNPAGATGTPHWALQGEAVPATGHNLALVESVGANNFTFVVADDTDYYISVDAKCSNKACDGNNAVYTTKYHSSADGTDDIDDVYNAIDIDQTHKKGADCTKYGHVTYTVKGLKDRTGAAVSVTKKAEDELSVDALKKTMGDHAYTVSSWSWHSTFESATATVKCGNKGCLEGHDTTPDVVKATVTKATAANGITTYTATYGTATDKKTAYTLEGAKVTYDTSKITDGNLINGVDGAAPQRPEFTVTLNGTVIDNSVLQETWTYANGTVNLTVKWADAVLDDDSVDSRATASQSASADPYKVSAKDTFRGVTAELTEDGEVVTYATDKRTYDSKKTTVVTAVLGKAYSKSGAKIKYAVTDGKVTVKKSESDADPNALQKKIEALDFNLDKVELKDVGDWYVYVQITADKYTTYTAELAALEIETAEVTVTIDNTTMIQGETPELKMVVTANGKVVDVDPSEFVVTSAGGQALENLLPGEYNLVVTSKSKNYKVITATPVPGRVNTITVLTKDGKTPEQEAAAAAEAADKALADANKITSNSDYTADSIAAIEAAKKALNDAMKGDASVEQIKKLTEDLNKAVKAAKKKTAGTITVSPSKKTIKAKKLKGKKKGFQLTAKTNSGAKVTFAKASGNKKIKVTADGKVYSTKKLKKGKYKVTVKATMPATGTHTSATVTKKITIKVKK